MSATKPAAYRNFERWLLFNHPNVWATRLHEYVFWSGIVGTGVALLAGASVSPYYLGGDGAGPLFTLMMAGLSGHLLYLLYRLRNDEPRIHTLRESTKVMLARFAVLALPSLNVLTFLLAHFAAHGHSDDTLFVALAGWGICTCYFLPVSAALTVIAHFTKLRMNGFVAGISFGFACLGLMVCWSVTALFVGLGSGLWPMIENASESVIVSLSLVYCVVAGLAIMAAQFGLLLGFQRALTDQFFRPRLTA